MSSLQSTAQSNALFLVVCRIVVLLSVLAMPSCRSAQGGSSIALMFTKSVTITKKESGNFTVSVRFASFEKKWAKEKVTIELKGDDEGIAIQPSQREVVLDDDGCSELEVKITVKYAARLGPHKINVTVKSADGYDTKGTYDFEVKE